MSAVESPRYQRVRAYLINGEFRVHQADCRDCQREARRSDSDGGIEEHACKADVIASLWSDIIAEDPGLYGTPGGLASLEAATVFLPCTSGLPDTSPAEDAGEVAAWAASLGLAALDLDDLVLDAYSWQAATTNNDGLQAQVRFLVDSYGADRARTLISDLQRPPPTPRRPAVSQGSADARRGDATRVTDLPSPAKQVHDALAGARTRLTVPARSASGMSARRRTSMSCTSCAVSRNGPATPSRRLRSGKRSRTADGNGWSVESRLTRWAWR